MTTGPHGDTPEGRAPYARRMCQESSVLYMDCLFSILAGSEETDGRFGLMEMVAPKGREPSRHLHFTDDEGFYVLDGNATFYVGHETYKASPGTFVFLPHGVPHSYTFETDVVRMLAIVAPGGLEKHFRDARFSEPAKALTLPPAKGEPDMAVLEQMSKDLAGYGTEVVGPPGPPQQGKQSSFDLHPSAEDPRALGNAGCRA
jgi:quercetin dioxygenase-like cupin family protein